MKRTHEKHEKRKKSCRERSVNKVTIFTLNYCSCFPLTVKNHDCQPDTGETFFASKRVFEKVCLPGYKIQ